MIERSRPLVEARTAVDDMNRTRVIGPSRHKVPQSTYRLQLRNGVGFDEVAQIVPYLAALGVSHVYLSPYLRAVSGTTHGYDVVDPAVLDPQLGGASAHRRMMDALALHGLGQVLDVVPNHMAITHGENRWWQEVLELGPRSTRARYFDLTWSPPGPGHEGHVLLPVLAREYGRTLADCELRLIRRGGEFQLSYRSWRFPVSLWSVAGLLEEVAIAQTDPALDEFVARLLPVGSGPDSGDPMSGDAKTARERRRELLTLLDGNPQVSSALDTRLLHVALDPAEMDALLERQHYRLAHWRAASQHLNYRRFFDNNTLVGLRVEDATVFDDYHALVLKWVREGVVGGLRVDHPDGLRDPHGYLQRLRDEAPGVWTVVEKILEPGEDLPEGWAADGTTGYDFGRLAMGLFLDPTAEGQLTATYREFTGEDRSFSAVALDGRRLAVRDLLGSDLRRLSRQLLEIAERRDQRGHTPQEFSDVLAELAATLPVYRTYLRAGGSEVGAMMATRELAIAAERVRSLRPDLNAALLNFVEDVLAMRLPGEDAEDLALRFQQLTGAVMAKGVEDTAFYRYHRLISLNEVGDDPEQFGVSSEQFHTAMAYRQRRWPRTMNATSTHDSKRSEDVRARINLLSELPLEWADAVRRWAELNEAGRRTPDAPDRNFEYFIYQTLVGVWPVTIERLWPVLEKSMREAKVQTSWNEPDARYERDVRRFTTAALERRSFIDDLSRFVSRLIPPARVASLAITLLRLTAPGIPDTYQGTELWDHSLVDPDNRRPVDFSVRRNLLDRLPGMSPHQVLAESDSGLSKLLVLTTGLQVRTCFPEAFGDAGTYVPLVAGGRGRRNVVGFTRGGQVATLVPRLPVRALSGWEDTTVALPRGFWADQFSGATFYGDRVPLKALLEGFPVALLVRQDREL